MKRTKSERMIACFDCYQASVGGRPCSTDEVCEWMDKHGLLDVPTVRDAPERQQAWDELFELVKATTEQKTKEARREGRSTQPAD